MSRTAWIAVLTIALAGPVHAQNGREHFMTPDTALDAVHAPQEQAFLLLRDSTSSISAAGAKLMSGMGPSSSLAWMRARARDVVAACARSVGPLGNARVVTEQGDWPESRQRKNQADLLKEMSSFSGVLADCQKRWTALAADTSQASLRNTAPHEMKELENKVDKFSRVARTYLRSIDIELQPGATSAP